MRLTKDVLILGAALCAGALFACIQHQNTVSAQPATPRTSSHASSLASAPRQVANLDLLARTSVENAVYVDESKAYFRMTVHNQSPRAILIDPSHINGGNWEIYREGQVRMINGFHDFGEVRGASWYSSDVRSALKHRGELLTVPAFGQTTFLVQFSQKSDVLERMNATRKYPTELVPACVPFTLFVNPRVVLIDATTKSYLANIYAPNTFTFTDVVQLKSK